MKNTSSPKILSHCLSCASLLCALLLLLSSTACQKREVRDQQTLIHKHKAQVQQLESQIHQQHGRIERWQLISITLGAGCFVLLVVGAALGAKTRNDADGHYRGHGKLSSDAHVES